MAHRRTSTLLSHEAVEDVDLVAEFQRTSDPAVLETLLQRYRRFARAKARGYFLIGGDADDVEQEALIGLYKAVRDYSPNHASSFRGFAELCIKRQIITAIKTATRQKHQPLNQYVSINAPKGGGGESSGDNEELLVNHATEDPADRVIAGERIRSMKASMDEVLSGLEVSVLQLYVEGKSYQEIGSQLGRHTKSIDNALQRIKRKLDGHLAQDVASAIAI